MPWNDQKGGGGGPWGSGSGGGPGGNDDSPWGRPNRPPGGNNNGGRQPEKPDLEETLRRMQDKFRGKPGGGNGSGGRPAGPGGGARGFGTTGLVILIGIGVVGWLMTGIYQVNEQSSAVVLRFGEYHRTEGPGFKIRLPNPIESHSTLQVNVINETAIGERAGENLMLTGDENIVDIDFSINWKINSPQQYLFNISEPQELIRQIGESAMREVVGASAFEPITTGDRTGVEQRVQALMQSTLNSYQSGIEIVSISLKGATAPAEVVEVQRDVSSAEQDKARREAEANAYRNKVVPEARGEAQRMLQEGEAYKESMVAIARGEADRFNSIYEEYRKSPRVTRERMFLETMEGVLGRTENTIVDTKQGTVPILPLDQLRGRSTERAQ